MNKLSSIQRRLLKEQEEQEEIELEVPEDGEIEPTEPDSGEESLDEIPLEEPDGEGTKAIDMGDDIEEPDKTQLITAAIDSLEQMRSTITKKGLLLAMHLSDFSTQRRLRAIADELGDIISHLSDRVLKTVAKSPMDVEKATNWLSGE